MAEHAPDPQHVANAAALTLDLASHLDAQGKTAADVANLSDAAWQDAYQHVRPFVRLRAHDRSPSVNTRQAVARLMERREAEANESPFRGFPQ